MRVLIALTLVIATGIFSRTPMGRLPWAAKEFGDTLWATMFYLWVLLFMAHLRWIALAMSTHSPFAQPLSFLNFIMRRAFIYDEPITFPDICLAMAFTGMILVAMRWESHLA